MSTETPAAGSDFDVAAIPGLAGNRWVMTASDVLGLPQLPKHLVIIGSGADEVDLARRFAEQKVPVTLLEAAPDLSAGANSSDSMTLASDLTKAGVKVRTGASVVEVGDLGEAASVEYREGLNAVARIFADAIVVPDNVIPGSTVDSGTPAETH